MLFHRISKSGSRLLIVLALTLLAPAMAQGQARIVSVQAIPASATIPGDAPSSVAVRWRVRIQYVFFDPITTILTARVQSPFADVFKSGTVFANLNGGLSRNVSGLQSSFQTIDFDEVVPISAALAAQIAAGSPVQLRRRFSAGTNSMLGQMTLNATTTLPPTPTPPTPTPPTPTPPTPTPPTTTPFGFTIHNFEFRFDDDSQYRVVKRNAPIAAQLWVLHSGNGILRGIWEVAEPSSVSLGTPRFFPLQRVRRPLAGTGRTLLRSPRLSTSLEGNHIVRFRIENQNQPRTSQLHYFVVPGDLQRDLEAFGPRAGAKMDRTAIFRWRPVAGAARYYLEFYTSRGGRIGPEIRPVAGVEVPGSRDATRLRAFTVARLRAHTPLSWRVVAIGRDGRMISASVYHPIEW